MTSVTSQIILIVLAAGEASRMGEVKQTLPVLGMPLIDFQMARWRPLFAMRPVVVTGAYQNEIKTTSKLKNISWVQNEHWQMGMGGSIIRGIEECRAHYTNAKACMIILLDQVGIGPVHILKLIDEWHAYPDRMIASKYEGVSGPPVVFPQRYWEELGKMNPSRGAAFLLCQYPDQVRSVVIPVAALDLDTQDDYQNFLVRLGNPSQSSADN